MSDPLIREIDNFVVLEPGKNEQFLNTEETLIWISNWLKNLDELPEDLKPKNSIENAAKHLLDTACDLEVKPGFTIQWFAVRLDSPNN
ncbi:chlororespiratory reduction protein 7 [Prochlorococcus sp. MIT 1223]|uniref:chlororespiratory reduction protein 7 n=1 Tax=Prochlorococcus sp. MIT 1223 TaxID=3096217 RepID=UPI002A760911|nr:chlororespiratory reduction protein 7 [Prochlorococcus sp. MIT 1223]